MPNVFKSVFSKNVPPSTGVTLYTSPNGTTSVIKSLYTANTSASTAGIDVFVGASGSATAFYIIKDAQVPTQSTLQAITEPIVLQQGDKIFVQPSVSGVDAVLSFMEVS